MPTDNLTAANLVVDKAGWQPMDSFPQDGSIVEIIDDRGSTCKAQWHSGRVLSGNISIGAPTGWRNI
jgi:hypothetical protein